jgi:hypothetical protein
LEEHDAVAVHRTGDDLAVVRPRPFAIFPELVVGLGVESGEPVLSRHEDVLLPMMFDQ